MLAVLDVIIFYINQGADVIRLDAIPYLWKEIGTTCIHLPQTYAFIQLLRAILDEITPNVLLIAEANVPHEENTSYLGDGENEAHMIYQFSLPPLTAHALISGSAQYLSSWASTLESPSRQTSFLNFTASHDGVGVRPAAGILPDAEVTRLIERTIAHGGKISSKTNPDGSKSPYELNINFYDLLNDPASSEPQSLQIDRFLASQAVMLMIKGIPGIYFHSLVGSRNDYEGAARTGHPRSINREKLNLQSFLSELKEPESLRYAVFSRYKALLEMRTTEYAFHPSGDQEVLDSGPAVFAVLRTSPDGNEHILAFQNVSSDAQDISLHLPESVPSEVDTWVDLLSGEKYRVEQETLTLRLSPYQTSWLKQKTGS
jgi:sucrose phosphorylase